MSTIKEQILRRLKDKSMSIYALEKKADLGINSVRNILNGASKEPKINTLQAIADALDCSVLDLLSQNITSPHQFEKFHQELLKKKDLDLELLRETFNIFHKICTQNQYNPTSEAALFVIKEIYYFSLGANDKNVNEQFATWMIESNCKR